MTPKHQNIASWLGFYENIRSSVYSAPLTPPLMVLLLRGLLILLLLLPRPGMDRNVKLRWLRANPTDENMKTYDASCAPTAHTPLLQFGWQFAGGPVSVSNFRSFYGYLFRLRWLRCHPPRHRLRRL